MNSTYWYVSKLWAISIIMLMGELSDGDLFFFLLLQNRLPPGYKYHFYRLCTPKVESHLDHTSFEASLRIALLEICEVRKWVKKLRESSGVSWRVAVTKPNKGQHVFYKVMSNQLIHLYTI